MSALRPRRANPYDRRVDFELTPEMIDKIAFAMEDQDQRFAIDVATGELSPLGDPSGAEDDGSCRCRAGARPRGST